MTDEPTIALKKGCCSAVSPCFHQKHDPHTICEACRNSELRANPPITDEPTSGVEAVLTIIYPEGARLMADGKNLTTGQADAYRDAKTKAEKIIAALATPAASPATLTREDERLLDKALSASTTVVYDIDPAPPALPSPTPEG